MFITLAAKDDLGSCSNKYVFCFKLPVFHLSWRYMCSVKVFSILSLIPYSISWAFSQNQQHLANLHSVICQNVNSSTTYEGHMLWGKWTVPLLGQIKNNSQSVCFSSLMMDLNYFVGSLVITNISSHIINWSFKCVTKTIGERNTNRSGSYL